MKEFAIQVMFFQKNKSQIKEVYKFLKKYQGQVLISVPINPRGLRK